MNVNFTNNQPFTINQPNGFNAIFKSSEFDSVSSFSGDKRFAASTFKKVLSFLAKKLFNQQPKTPISPLNNHFASNSAQSFFNESPLRSNNAQPTEPFVVLLFVSSASSLLGNEPIVFAIPISLSGLPQQAPKSTFSPFSSFDDDTHFSSESTSSKPFSWASEPEPFTNTQDDFFGTQNNSYKSQDNFFGTQENFFNEGTNKQDSHFKSAGPEQNQYQNQNHYQYQNAGQSNRNEQQGGVGAEPKVSIADQAKLTLDTFTETANKYLKTKASGVITPLQEASDQLSSAKTNEDIAEASENFKKALKTAYRKIALVAHPDKNPANAEAAKVDFQKLSSAKDDFDDIS